MKNYSSLKILCFLFLLASYGCASYHTKSLQYQAEIQNGFLEEASKSIEKNRFLKKKRNLLLYYFEKGKVAHLQGNYKESNLLFNKADILIEDARKKIGDEILGIVTNQEKTIYRAEDFEKVAIHYYKALNYIFLNKYDDALVEAKRINLQLQKINEKYPEGKKNRYTSDAFALNLQGILYEALGNTNDAFISYRNAIDLYLKAEGIYFGVSAPEQLKKDLLRTAHELGFSNEESRYSKLLKTTYQPTNQQKSEVVIFWENGLIPYKDQTFYNFSVLPGNGVGSFNIINKDLNLNFHVPIQNTQNSNFSDLKIFNIAFPKYTYRAPYYRQAKVVVDSIHEYPFELAQDYAEIAFKTLKDRTLREIGQVALRLAVKKTSEYSLRKKNEELGTLLGLFNSLTERSDTRNWQTLPKDIYYTRVPLDKKQQKLEIVAFKENNTVIKTIEITSKKQLQFVNFTTPKTLRENY